MSGAYIQNKGRYDTVLSVLKEQIDEYFKVDSDLNSIVEISELQSTGGNDLLVDVTRVLTNRKSQIMKGIHYNCQLIAMGEGDPVKEDNE